MLQLASPGKTSERMCALVLMLQGMTLLMMGSAEALPEEPAVRPMFVEDMTEEQLASAVSKKPDQCSCSRNPSFFFSCADFENIAHSLSALSLKPRRCQAVKSPMSFAGLLFSALAQVLAVHVQDKRQKWKTPNV